jgi:hypothetical protein
LRIDPLFLAVILGGGLVSGCHKQAPETVNGDAVKQSLDGLRKQFAELKTRFMDLRERVESIPPSDPPGFNDARARFYAAEEARGTTDAKVAWLTGRLDAALSTGNRDELQQISNEIAQTQVDIGKINEVHVTLLHQIMALQRLARDEGEAPAVAPPPTPVPAKTKRPSAKH